jgi:hypothetical protein
MVQKAVFFPGKAGLKENPIRITLVPMKTHKYVFMDNYYTAARYVSLT